jgi:hypothetical protein
MTVRALRPPAFSHLMVTLGTAVKLKRTQEIQEVLLLALFQAVEKPPHYPIRLGPPTPVFPDCAFQIRGPAVMKEEDALSKSPEGGGPKLSRRGLALTDPVGEPVPHVVKRKVGVQICRLSAERCDSRSAGAAAVLTRKMGTVLDIGFGPELA